MHESIKPRLLGALLALLLVTGGATPARAALWSGTCAVQVTIAFRAPLRPPLSAPNYDISAGGAADLDPTTGGMQPCARTLSTEVFGTTAAGGSGHAIAWSCGTTLATGSWEQGFGAEGPAPFSGSHVLTGSWGAWTLAIHSTELNVIAVGELALQASEAGKTRSCATGSLESVTMVGVLVFQDP